MSYQNNTYNIMLKKLGIDLQNAHRVDGKDNKYTTFCPQCHKDRKPGHQRQRELSLNLGSGHYHCYHCGWEGRMDTDQYLEKKKEYLEHHDQYLRRQVTHQYQRPKVDKTSLEKRYADGIDTPYTEKMLAYLTKQRQIPLSVLRRAKVGEAVEVMPQTKQKMQCVVFNYYEQGTLVNQKFRDGKKDFKMVPGAELIPYHIDSLLDTQEAFITEGEFDTLSLMAAGYEAAISMPSGASGGTQWMDRFWDTHFEHKERIYIATDMDAPGQQAAAELAKRFGPEICYRINFSPDCKDANEELCRHGIDSLRQRVEEATPLPLGNIQTLADFEQDLDSLYTLGPQQGATTGWRNLDTGSMTSIEEEEEKKASGMALGMAENKKASGMVENKEERKRGVTFGLGQLALVTGRTNDGKSEWLDELVIRLMLRTGWHTGYWTPENTLLDHSQKIIEKLCNRHLRHEGTTGVQPTQFDVCKRWMAANMAWIDLRSSEQKLDNILSSARSLVRKFGIKMLVLDPFNFIEKENGAYMSENAWDSHVVGTLRDFAMEQNLLIFLVAHPRKVEMKIDGDKRRITMEDISGTADFGNKADYCFCIDRNDKDHIVTVSVDKVRRKMYGSKGLQVYFKYDLNSGRYYPCEKHPGTGFPCNVDYYSNTGCWLTQDVFGNITPTEKIAVIDQPHY